MASAGNDIVTLDMLKAYVPSKDDLADEPTLRQAALRVINRVDGGLNTGGPIVRSYVLEHPDDPARTIQTRCTKKKATYYQLRLLQLVRCRARGSPKGRTPSRRNETRSAKEKRAKVTQEASENESPTRLSVSTKLVPKILDLLIKQGKGGARYACYLKELRLVSLEVCDAARPFLRWSVTVGSEGGLPLKEFLQRTGHNVSHGAGAAAAGEADGSGGPRSERAQIREVPHSLANAGKQPSGNDATTAKQKSRVPKLTPTTVIWALSATEMMGCREALSRVTTLHLGRTDPYWRPTEFDESIADVEWPPRLQQLCFGSSFDQPIEDVTWPPSLRRMEFVGPFNQSLVEVNWPSALRCLVFHYTFNQPIHQVTWPNSLESIWFGGNFNHPIVGVRWPSSLKNVVFGSDFNQPVNNVSWPGRLRQVVFGDDLNQPIDQVFWPDSLERIIFGDSFNKPVSAVSWPCSLHQVVFGHDFDNPIEEVSWPDSLRRLAFGRNFNQPLAQVVWPAHLKELSFGDLFDQPVTEVTWPSSLESLSFGSAFHSSLDDVRWPNSLRKLNLGGFNAPPHGITWPEKLGCLVLYESYDRNDGCGDVGWPPTMNVFYGQHQVQWSTA